jgi:peptidoglycan/xylan/chitin deacetylase (PgdA/CDA1 family)
MKNIAIFKQLVLKMLLKFQARAIILLYHKITETSLDTNMLSVTPQHFSEHLEYLQKHYHLLSLVELGRALSANRVPNRAVVVTLDDGYLDNLWNAKPLLEHYNVPATLFVTTGYLGKNKEFWWDELERILFLAEVHPEQLSFNIDDKFYKWNFRQDKEQDLVQRVYKDIQCLLRPLEDEHRQQVLNDLARLTSAQKDARQSYRALNLDELRMLCDNGLLEIGSHTITHPVLSTQPLDVQKREIVQSKQYLEDILGRPVNSFSYPYGGINDLSDKTMRLIREAGYLVACTTISSFVTRQSDSYYLPRYMIKDCGREEFASRIKSFFDI